MLDYWSVSIFISWTISHFLQPLDHGYDFLTPSPPNHCTMAMLSTPSPPTPEKKHDPNQMMIQPWYFQRLILNLCPMWSRNFASNIHPTVALWNETLTTCQLWNHKRHVWQDILQRLCRFLLWCLFLLTWGACPMYHAENSTQITVSEKTYPIPACFFFKSWAV